MVSVLGSLTVSIVTLLMSKVGKKRKSLYSCPEKAKQTKQEYLLLNLLAVLATSEKRFLEKIKQYR